MSSSDDERSHGPESTVTSDIPSTKRVVRISRRERTATEILDALDAGRRVLIEVSVAGKTMEMAIRESSGTYYCDTPVKLLTYENEDGLRDCLERYRLARPEEEALAEVRE